MKPTPWISDIEVTVQSVGLSGEMQGEKGEFQWMEHFKVHE